MRILAIETSDRSGSVAALNDAHVLAFHDLDPTLRSAVSLAPALAELLRNVDWQPRDVQLVAVATGPGSFTGLRVGVTTAKMFAYAIGAEVQGVNTLEAIAWQAPDEVRELWTLLDAQRDQLFAGRFSLSESAQWQWYGATQLLDNQAWLAQLPAAEKGIAVSGPGLIKLVDKISSTVRVLERSLWTPQAATVGLLAWHQYQRGHRDEAASLVPHYFRPSAAEEKRIAKQPIP